MKLGIPKPRAAKLQAAILGQFRRLKAWIEESLAYGRKYGFCHTWWDGQDFRRRPLPDLGSAIDSIRESAERSTWNTRVQGTASEFTLQSIIRMQKALELGRLPAKQILTVYDSILWEVEESAADDLIGTAGEVMVDFNTCGVPLKVDFKKGYSWGDMQKVA